VIIVDGKASSFDGLYVSLTCSRRGRAAEATAGQVLDRPAGMTPAWRGLSQRPIRLRLRSTY